MMEPGVEALTRLRDALAELAGALASGQTDAVLNAEAPLVDAIRQLPPPSSAPSFTDRAAARALVGEIRVLMHRSERLGAAVRDLVMLSGRFSRHAYGPRGDLVPPVARPTLVSRS